MWPFNFSSCVKFGPQAWHIELAKIAYKWLADSHLSSLPIAGQKKVKHDILKGLDYILSRGDHHTSESYQQIEAIQKMLT